MVSMGSMVPARAAIGGLLGATAILFLPTPGAEADGRVLGGGSSTAPSSYASNPSPAAAQGFARATFAGGCFWCLETAFEGVPGVVSAVSGYSGGPKQNPKYEEVGAGGTGHAEVVQVLYDPRKIGYEKLLYIFWRNIDPLSAGGQFCDRGSQYRSAIFYHDATQRRLAENSKRVLEASKRFGQPIVTEIVAFVKFWPAEEYHQDFYKKEPEHYRSYREGCGRDLRLKEIWGAEAPKHRA
jgi:peptide-methionine (S)-S-oxide reductase